MYYELTDSFIVKAGLTETWSFFANPANLPRITPRWLGFTVDKGNPATISHNTILNYTIRWLGLKLKWRTQIIEWMPNTHFTDLQTKGPYALWHHQHSFEAVPEGTLCRDRVIYKLPVPGINRIVQRLIVRKQVRSIFEHRRAVIGSELGLVREVAAIELRTLR